MCLYVYTYMSCCLWTLILFFFLDWFLHWSGSPSAKLCAASFDGNGSPTSTSHFSPSSLLRDILLKPRKSHYQCHCVQCLVSNLLKLYLRLSVGETKLKVGWSVSSWALCCYFGSIMACSGRNALNHDLIFLHVPPKFYLIAQLVFTLLEVLSSLFLDVYLVVSFFSLMWWKLSCELKK